MAQSPADERTKASLAPYKTRAENAQADRALRNTALAAAGDRVLARLNLEREEGDSWEPEMALTGEKPKVDEEEVRAHMDRELRIVYDEAVEEAEVDSGPKDKFSAKERKGAPSAPAKEEPAAEAGGASALFERAQAALEEERSKPAPPPVVATPPAPRPAAEEGPAPMDIPGIIRELAALHKDGILTDEEFGEKKADLLSRL